jgi:hypothetical protein
LASFWPVLPGVAFSPQIFDPLRDSCPTLRVSARDRHLRAFFREKQRGRLANARRPACDESNFILEPHTVPSTLCFL